MEFKLALMIAEFVVLVMISRVRFVEMIIQNANNAKKSSGF